MAKKELGLNRKLKFGVEIEMIPTATVTCEVVANALNQAGINASYEGYTHRVIAGVWKIVTDASIMSAHGRGIEVVSPVLKGLEGLKELERVLKVLNDIGCKVDKQCGIHVHHDINDFNMENVKNVYRLYNKHIEVLDSMMPESRRKENNQWCRGFSKRELNAIEECATFEEVLSFLTENRARSSKRYKKVNLCSYLSYGTIEFRHHGASLSYEKISNWVLLTHKILDRAGQDIKVKPKTAKRIELCKADAKHSSYDLYMELGINATDLSKYVGQRRKQLAKIQEEEVA